MKMDLIKELPFDAVKEGRTWQQMAEDDSKQEWDALQEWAKTFKSRFGPLCRWVAFS